MSYLCGVWRPPPHFIVWIYHQMSSLIKFPIKLGNGFIIIHCVKLEMQRVKWILIAKFEVLTVVLLKIQILRCYAMLSGKYSYQLPTT
jgi:hypothetical protein